MHTFNLLVKYFLSKHFYVTIANSRIRFIYILISKLIFRYKKEILDLLKILEI